MPNLNPNAQLWVDALRSGDYKQATGCLENAKGDCCCLGVGCRVAIKNGASVNVTRHTVNDVMLDVMLFDNKAEVLPESVRAWLKLRTHAGLYSNRGQLTKDNDQGQDFIAIADIIESHPELFEDE